jgi:hypothetical protein
MEAVISNERAETIECNIIPNKGKNLGESFKTSHKSGPGDKSLCDFQNNKIKGSLMNIRSKFVTMLH